MSKRKQIHWKCGERTLELGSQTQVMGILNVTPDSFSDGGHYTKLEKAVQRGLEMVAQGASIIDIGGESTRPGAEPVSAEEEIRRVTPVIKALRAETPAFISIDTTKAAVAAAALKAGADIINDVSAFETDPDMFKLAAESGAGVVLMHMKGSPQTMQLQPEYSSLLQEITSYLQHRVDCCLHHAILPEQLVLDPGLGFGKTCEHNLDILRHLSVFSQMGYPLLIGASRKSFIGHVLQRKDPAQRLAGSLASAAWSIQHGAHILRAHDVIETCDICGLMDTLLQGERLCI